MSDFQERFSAALTASDTSAPAAPAPAPAPEPVAAAAAPAASTPEPVSAPEAAAPATTDTPAAPEIGEEEEFKFPDETAPAPKADAPAADDEDPFDGKPQTDVDKAAVTKWLKTPKGKMSLQGFKTMRELGKPVTEGGLGFVPDASQMKQAFAHSGLFQAMTQDFNSGKPENARNFVAQMFLPQEGRDISPGALEVAKNFVPLLQEAVNKNPQLASLYQAVAIPAVDNYINELYDYAASMETPEDRTLWTNIARHAEAHRTGGKFRDVSEDFLKTGKDPNAPDPRLAEIDQKLAKIQNYETQTAKQAEIRFNGAVKQSIETPLMADIHTALGQIKDKIPGKVYDAIVQQFHKEVVDNTRANPANLRAYFNARAIARQSPTEANIRAAGKAWAECARPAIRSLRPSYINDALKPIVSESAERIKTLEEASQKRGAPSVAAPVGKNLATGPEKPLPGENYRDTMQRRFASVMQNAS